MSNPPESDAKQSQQEITLQVKDHSCICGKPCCWEQMKPVVEALEYYARVDFKGEFNDDNGNSRAIEALAALKSVTGETGCKECLFNLPHICTTKEGR